MARAILLAMCCMEAVGAANVFFAKMKPLESDGPSGWVAVAVTPSGLVGLGTAKGLEPKLRAAPGGEDCVATNGCGTHVHSGTACTDATTQGGHYFAANETDPWKTVGYSFTSRKGWTHFKFSMETTAREISQKPFIIHNNAGGRVACGLLTPIGSGDLPKYVAQLLHVNKLSEMKGLENDEHGNYDGDDEDAEDVVSEHEDDEANAEDEHEEHDDDDEDDEEDDEENEDEEDPEDDQDDEEGIPASAKVFFANMKPLESQGPVGWVAVVVTPSGLVGAGTAIGLEPNLQASPDGANCTAANGCGAHVHSGTACTNVTTQGGHYFAADVADPWVNVGYTRTNRKGFTLFKFSMETTAQDIAQKPFIVHSNAGRRVACGLLEPVLSGKLPKYAAQLLMRNMSAHKELEHDEDEHHANGGDSDERRRLEVATILV